MFSSESRCPLGNIDSLPPRAESLTMCFRPAARTSLTKFASSAGRSRTGGPTRKIFSTPCNAARIVFRFGVIHDHTFQSRRGFGCYGRRLESSAYLQPHGQRLLYHFTTDVPTCSSDQNHSSLLSADVKG